MAKEISIKQFANLISKGRFKEIEESILIINLDPKSLYITKGNSIITNGNNKFKAGNIKAAAEKSGRRIHNKGAFKESRNKLQACLSRGDKNE
ncbi:MAG: hypothetical protein AABX27_00930 [Nanoarchaeota archaeon]